MSKVVDGKIVLNTEESILIKNGVEFEIIPNRKGIFLLIEKTLANEASHIVCSIDDSSKTAEPVDTSEVDEVGIEVVEKIRTAKLSELVEGKFELTLNPDQKKALLKLIKNKKIILFKLNDNYKKGVYKLAEEGKIVDNTPKESEDFNAKKKATPDYTLSKDGFISTTNTERARILSSEYKVQIEKNELRGIKSFEGVYYLISDVLLEKHLGNLLNILEKEGEISLENLAKEENISTELAKIICEFLKEDGEILESQQGNYKYIN
jgi:hypothetical protein